MKQPSFPNDRMIRELLPAGLRPIMQLLSANKISLSRRG